MGVCQNPAFGEKGKPAADLGAFQGSSAEADFKGYRAEEETGISGADPYLDPAGTILQYD